MTHDFLRDTDGRAMTYSDPVRAAQDAERAERENPAIIASVEWVPMPRRPWRVMLWEREQ